jgi:hypothetical protein
MTRGMSPQHEHFRGVIPPNAVPNYPALAWFATSMLWPRLAIVALWIFSDLLGDAYDSWVLPVLGFLVLPWTTMIYAFMWTTASDGAHDVEWVALALALLLDLCTYLVGSRLTQRD